MRCLFVSLLGALLALHHHSGVSAFLFPAPSSSSSAGLGTSYFDLCVTRSSSPPPSNPPPTPPHPHTASRSAAATPLHHALHQSRPSFKTLLTAASDNAGASINDDDDDEEAIPGKMKVGEIKAELDLRGVTYAGVFERPELEALLLKARVEGKARPEILDTFNQQR